MSNLTLRGNPAGTGTFTLESPNSNTSRTLILPDASTTLVGTDATQTLTNKTLNGGALTLMTAQNSTSGTNIDFTGIPSWARRVTVMFSGVSLSGAASILVQIGSGSFVTTGYVSSSAATNGTDIDNTNGIVIATGGASVSQSTTLTLFNITGNSWMSSHQGSLIGTTLGVVGGSNALALSGALDRVRITTTTGADTFDAGTINVMYEG